MDETAPPPSTASLNAWVGLASAIIAPTTLLTALAYYFGYVSTHKYFGYFNVNTDLLRFTTTEYVLRSVQVMYPQIAIFLIVSWVGLGIRELVARAIISGRQLSTIRALGWTGIGAGLVFLTYALVSFLPTHKPAVLDSVVVATVLVVGGGWVRVRYRHASNGRQRTLGATGWLLLSGAAVALTYVLAVLLGRLLAGMSWLHGAHASCRAGCRCHSCRRRYMDTARDPNRPPAPQHRTCRTCKPAHSTRSDRARPVWIANILATASGARDAENFASQVAEHPNVIVDTTEKLHLSDQNVCEIPIPATDSNQRFLYRYKNLRELAARNDRWFLVPTDWQQHKGFILIIPMHDDSARLRIEQIPEHATVLCPA